MRVQLNVSDKAITDLKVIMAKTGSETYKELFNNAVTLLRWAVAQKCQGRSLYSVDEKTDTWIELQMPALEYCAEAAHNPPAPTAEPQSAVA